MATGDSTNRDAWSFSKLPDKAFGNPNILAPQSYCGCRILQLSWDAIAECSLDMLGHAWTSCRIRATSLPSLPSFSFIFRILLSSFISFVSHGVSHGSPLRVKSFNGTKGFGFIICEARDLGLRKKRETNVKKQDAKHCLTLLNNFGFTFWLYFELFLDCGCNEAGVLFVDLLTFLVPFEVLLNLLVGKSFLVRQV